MLGDKFRLRFEKAGVLRLLSHHDLMRVLERMLRRAGLPFKSTAGFHPGPRVVFAQSLPLGVAGRDEVVELELTEVRDSDDVLTGLNSQAPEGLRFNRATVVPMKTTAMPRRIVYTLPLPDDRVEEATAACAELLAADAVWVERVRPSPKGLNIRRYLRRVEVIVPQPNPPGSPSLRGKGGDEVRNLPGESITSAVSQDAVVSEHPSPLGGGAGGGVATHAPVQAGRRADAPNPPGPPSLGGKGGDEPPSFPGAPSASTESQEAELRGHPSPPGGGAGGGVATSAPLQVAAQSVSPAHSIVRGQWVEEGKAERARQFRRNLTPTERALWECLRRDQLGGFHFRRQQVIDGFIADFYCHAAALVVEADGASHDDRVEADADRDRVFERRGLLVHRVRNESVAADIEAVLRAIQSVCRERVGRADAPNPPGPPSLGGKGGDEVRNLPGESITSAVSQDAVVSEHPSPLGGGAGGGVATSAPVPAEQHADAPNPPGPPSLGGKGGDEATTLPGAPLASAVSREDGLRGLPLPPWGRGPGGGVDRANPTTSIASATHAPRLLLDLWVTTTGTARADELLRLLGVDDLLDAGCVLERTLVELRDEAAVPPDPTDTPPDGPASTRPADPARAARAGLDQPVASTSVAVPGDLAAE